MVSSLRLVALGADPIFLPISLFFRLLQAEQSLPCPMLCTFTFPPSSTLDRKSVV